MPGRGPDRDAALAQYRRRAAIYDIELVFFEPVRRRAVARLALQPGETVLDVGCGTGLSLPLLAPAVGRKGRVVGIEQSPEMIERARARVGQARWPQVSLINQPVESVKLVGMADAALFHFTHDILQREDAVRNVIEHLKPGARVVASGLQWAPPWAVAVNLLVLPAALRSVSSLVGLDRPWRALEPHLRDLQVIDLLGGGVYLASGVFQ